jgi:hypothetical protein
MDPIVYYFENTNISEAQWAAENLSPEELSEYTQDRNNSVSYFNYLQSTGKLVIEPLFENVFVEDLNAEISLRTGIKIIPSEGVSPEEIAPSEQYDRWLQRYQQFLLTIQQQ